MRVLVVHGDAFSFESSAHGRARDEYLSPSSFAFADASGFFNDPNSGTYYYYAQIPSADVPIDLLYQLECEVKAGNFY